MAEFFILLLMQVTIFSSVTALIIIAVKQIFKCRIPPKIGVVLWLVLLVRLICPIFPESEYSIYNLIPAGRTIMYTLQNDIAQDLDAREAVRAAEDNPYVLDSSAAEAVPDVSSTVQTEESAITIGAYINDMIDESSADYTQYFNRIVLILYGVGIAMTLSVSALLYSHARRRIVRMSVLCEDEALLRCYRETAEKMHIREDRIPPLRTGCTDMVIGCLNPAVVCRENLDPKEAPMVFAHELSHYKYGDNPILLFSTFVTCLFWYNPLIWLVRSILREDLEVLCDQRTLSECGIPRTEYAMMLCRQSAFDVLHTDAVRAGCRMSAAGRQLKTRLRTISKNGRERYLAKAGSLVLCSVIVMLCLTNPIVSQNDDYAAYIASYAALTGENERTMHLEDNVTVSEYLEQLSRILEETGLSSRIGSGNLEQFRRLAAGSDKLNDDLLAELRQLRTTEPLTNKNLALIDKCASALLEWDPADRDNAGLVLPGVISAAEMNMLSANLTPSEAAALLSCYNRGVSGAEVEFDFAYTNAMMELILSRIGNDWIRSKLNGFYQQIDLTDGTGNFSSRLTELVKGAGRRKSLYICDPGITKVEITMLREMIGAAEAGTREDVYYLKEYEDVYPVELAAMLLERAGYTADRVIRSHSEIGELRYRMLTEENCAVLNSLEMNGILERLSRDDGVRFKQAYEAVTDITQSGNGSYVTEYYRLREGASVKEILDGLNRVKFASVRDGSEISVTGVTESCLADAAAEMYSLGLMDCTDGVIDMTERLSCGQSLCAAYRFACAVTNVN